MKSLAKVYNELIDIGVTPPMTFGSREIRHLEEVLTKNEKIEGFLAGWYDGGIAILVATNCRLILVDKILWNLIVEDYLYDQITEVDFRKNLIHASISIHSRGDVLKFSSLRKEDVFLFSRYLENRIHNIHSLKSQMEYANMPLYDDVDLRKAI